MEAAVDPAIVLWAQALAQDPRLVGDKFHDLRYVEGITNVALGIAGRWWSHPEECVAISKADTGHSIEHLWLHHHPNNNKTYL